MKLISSKFLLFIFFHLPLGKTQQNLGMLVQGYISLPFPNTLNLPKQTPFTRAAHIQHGGNSGNA